MPEISSFPTEHFKKQHEQRAPSTRFVKRVHLSQKTLPTTLLVAGGSFGLLPSAAQWKYRFRR